LFGLCAIALLVSIVVASFNVGLAQVENSLVLQPKVTDTKLKVELVSNLQGFPTNMVFIDKDDILILSKNGQVLRIKDGKNLGPVFELNVTNKDEMGLLGIDTDLYSKNKAQVNKAKVFLYYSLCESNLECNNFVYKYSWNAKQQKLDNPRLLLKLPGLPGPSHVGGDITIGPDGYVYLTIGDLLRTDLFNKDKKYNTEAQNYRDGVEADGRAGILRFTKDGKPVGNGTIGDHYPLNLYFAYGIKNSFGIAFDPATSKLWDTENGPSFGDEINLVEPGFNSGWSQIQGIWRVNPSTSEKMGLLEGEPTGLESFGGKGKYIEPKLVWDNTAAPTALLFMNSEELGSRYLNNMFVGSVDDGKIFHLELNQNRTGFSLPDSINDRLITKGQDSEILFAEGFGIVTDMQVGADDGYLYVVSGDRPTKSGAMYKIIPK
jgi:glucose/arabinose dehydrogenase